MKIELNITNKFTFVITALALILVVSIVVYAYGATDPTIHGHSQSEIEPAETFVVNSNRIDTLTPGKKYLISVHGVTDSKGLGSQTLAKSSIKECISVSVLAETPNKNIVGPYGNAPITVNFIITAPTSGCIDSFLDGNSGTVLQMTALSI